MLIHSTAATSEHPTQVIVVRLLAPWYENVVMFGLLVRLRETRFAGNLKVVIAPPAGNS